MVIAVLTAADDLEMDSLEALPVGIQPSGPRVVVPAESDPGLQEGTVVDVMIDADIAAFRAQATVVEMLPAEDTLELKLQWLNPERARIRMPGAVLQALVDNQAQFGQPIRAQLDRGSGLCGHLLDLCGDSITLGLEPAAAPRANEVVQLRLELGPNEETVRVRARSTSRAVSDHEVAITFRFRGTPQELSRLDDRIHQHLAGRQTRRASKL